jgi:hypothetical protein
MRAVRLIAGMPPVKVIVVNLLGGITRCDDVARGIIDSKVSQKIVVRLAGTNEREGRQLLAEHGYIMHETMEQAVEFPDPPRTTDFGGLAVPPFHRDLCADLPDRFRLRHHPPPSEIKVTLQAKAKQANPHAPQRESAVRASLEK